MAGFVLGVAGSGFCGILHRQHKMIKKKSKGYTIIWVVSNRLSSDFVMLNNTSLRRKV